MSKDTGTLMGTGSAIELQGLRRHFGERVVLDEVSLSVAQGQTLVIFGPNGAGKSTLLRVLASLLRPHGGNVRVFGHELPRGAWAVRGRVGLLAHEPLLYRELSARENLTFHARLHGVGGERVQQLLEAVALGSRGSEPLRALSRGMVQRVAIARAVLHDPQLLLLDEPYANLDPAARGLAGDLIGRAPGRTRVLCSHDPAGLAQADVVLGLRAGRVALLRRAADVHESEIAELYR
jgi:heme exporter protein A